MSNPRFDVRFDPDAPAEYQRLDHALAVIVDKALARLEEQADEIGTPLQNKYATKLHGCKEIKLLKAGLRVTFLTIRLMFFALSIFLRSNGVILISCSAWRADDYEP